MSFVMILHYLPSDSNSLFVVVSMSLTDFEQQSVVIRNNRIVLQYLVVGKVLRWLREDPPIRPFFFYFFLFLFFISCIRC